MLREHKAETSLLADMACAIWHADRHALRRVADATGIGPEQAAARLQIHASTTWETLTRALAEAVPSLAAMLPAEEFAVLARRFTAAHPPAQAALHTWGDDLAAFLVADAAPAEWIAMARLDRAWMAAFFAAEAEPVEAARLAVLPPSSIPGTYLVPHPSLRLVRLDGDWFDAWCARGALPQLEYRSETCSDGTLVALSRPQARVRALGLTGAAFAFLSALQGGATLLDACDFAVREDSGFELQAHLSNVFANGFIADCLPGE
jgi:hypothetical protein